MIMNIAVKTPVPHMIYAEGSNITVASSASLIEWKSRFARETFELMAVRATPLPFINSAIVIIQILVET